MTPTPKRRWFSFSLRTLFVAVTVFGTALGWWLWQIELVRERKQMLTQIWERGGLVYVRDPAMALLRPDTPLPIWRRWLGDRPQCFIAIKRELDPDNSDFFDRADRLFPEAKLRFGLPEWEADLQAQVSRLRTENIEARKRAGLPSDFGMAP